MIRNAKSTDLVKMLHLKKVGLALASLWVMILISAVAATIYREIDGPTVRATTFANLNLSAANSSLNSDLITAQATIEQLNIDLLGSHSDYDDLKSKLESYLSSAPLLQTGP